MAESELANKKLGAEISDLLGVNNPNFSVSVTEDVDDQDINLSSDDSCSDHEDGPCGHDHHSGSQDSSSAVQHYSRNEKKARKLISKLGLVQVPDITRVTICRSKNVVFVISKPDVYKNPTTNSYIVFGEAKVEDLGMAAQAQAARRFQEQQEAMLKEIPSDAPSSTLAISEIDESVPIDESGLEMKDIEMIMSQCSVSRRRAVAALRENEGDIVNAIMALSE